MNAKQLHKHSLPVVILTAGLVVVTAMVVSRLLAVSGQPGDTLTQLLSERTVTLRPARSGWFQASRYQPEAQADSGLTLNDQQSTDTGLTAIGDAGQDTALDASLAQ